MAASTSPDDLGITDIEFDTITIDHSLAGPQQTSPAPATDPTTGSARPVLPGVPTDLLEVEPTKVERNFEKWLKGKVRQMWWLARLEKIKKPFKALHNTQKKYTPKHVVARVGCFLAAFTLALTVFEYIHIKEPTLAIGERATAAAEASARAAQYAQYINWLTNVCPAEIVSLAVLLCIQ